MRNNPVSPTVSTRDIVRSFQPLLEIYLAARRQSFYLCRNLEDEDHQLQAAPFVSPLKWHLAHVTWFFETFSLKPFMPSYRVFHPKFEMLFNSYYQGVGLPFERPKRGVLSRPTLAEVCQYRHYVDEAMEALLTSEGDVEEIKKRTLLGINHEQQHQELMLMDIKYNFFQNPLAPIYRPIPAVYPGPADSLTWTELDGGLVSLGHADSGFCFDNEMPEHQVFLNPYRLANRLVTNGEFAAFIAADGYRQPSLWLSDGWDWVQQNQVRQPLYWQKVAGEWHEYGLNHHGPLQESAPVCHISYYEAQAFATWMGCRLPTEQEWEFASKTWVGQSQFLEADLFHPLPAPKASGIQQLWGTVWEWTQSPYTPYPGFQPTEGALGEYNGKFMCNQWVLRGGSFATPQTHFRQTYRNFFYPSDRWAFCGIRLAKNC